MKKRYFNRSNTPKSQLIYVVLALFLGAFGVHNFYAERWGRGLIQLLITLCTGFVGSVISSLWALVNIFSIETDGNNRPFEMNPVAKYICGILGIIKYLGEIVFWGFLLVGMITGSTTALGHHFIKKNWTVQKQVEKIVKPNETIYQTTETVSAE